MYNMKHKDFVMDKKQAKKKTKGIGGLISFLTLPIILGRTMSYSKTSSFLFGDRSPN